MGILENTWIIVFPVHVMVHCHYIGSELGEIAMGQVATVNRVP